jgi:hypothetical protein
MPLRLYIQRYYITGGREKAYMIEAFAAAQKQKAAGLD